MRTAAFVVTALGLLSSAFAQADEDIPSGGSGGITVGGDGSVGITVIGGDNGAPGTTIIDYGPDRPGVTLTGGASLTQPNDTPEQTGGSGGAGHSDRHEGHGQTEDNSAPTTTERTTSAPTTTAQTTAKTTSSTTSSTTAKKNNAALPTGMSWVGAGMIAAGALVL